MPRFTGPVWGRGGRERGRGEGGGEDQLLSVRCLSS